MKAIILIFCLTLTSLAFAENLPAEESTNESAQAEKAKQENTQKQSDREPAHAKKQLANDYDPIGRIR